MESLHPNLMVQNIRKTIDFYTKILGFEIVMLVDDDEQGIDLSLEDGKNYVWALIKKGNVEIMLQEAESLKKDIPSFAGFEVKSSISLYIKLSNLQEFYEKIKDNVEIVKDFATSWYGMDEFCIFDNNGYVLVFSQKSQEH